MPWLPVRRHWPARGSPSGEVSERLKEHAWKVCMRKRIEGSNPSLSAIAVRNFGAYLAPDSLSFTAEFLVKFNKIKVLQE